MKISHKGGFPHSKSHPSDLDINETIRSIFGNRLKFLSGFKNVYMNKN